MDWSEFLLPGVIALIVFGGFFASRSESKKFNKGVCPNCGAGLVLNGWMVDSQGGRGWTCPTKDCHYTAWVSYPFVDKKYRQRLGI